MMTPQEVAATTFPKAKFGGYNMASVDVFLDGLTEDYTELYKENAALKEKNEALREKLKEKVDQLEGAPSLDEKYRAMEDEYVEKQKVVSSILIAAEMTANKIKREAEEKCAAMISDAEADARVRMRELAADVAAEERRLAAVHDEIDRQIAIERERLVVAQRELAAFINGAKALCNKQMGLIDRLSELDILPTGFQMTQPLSELETLPVDSDIPDTQAEEAALPITEETPVAPVDEDVTDDQPDSKVFALVESIRSEISAFTGECGITDKEEDAAPVDTGFDAGQLFVVKNDTPECSEADEVVADPFDHTDDEDDDNFNDEEDTTTRIFSHNDLQFGRNYRKD